MSRLSEEVRRVPRAGWLIAAVVYAGMVALTYVVLGRSPDTRAWPEWGTALFRVAAPIPLAIYALLISYVYSDAQRRGMRHVLWTLLSIFVPNGIGIILYFVLRDPVLTPCPSCGAMAKAGFAYCPKCGSAVGNACPQCRRPVEASWANCAYCGARL